MTASDDGVPPSRRMAVLLRGLASFAVFLVLGPLIGWLFSIAALLSRGVPENFGRDLPLSLAFGYGIGLIPAAVAGFIIVARDVIGRPANLVLAAAVGGAIGAVWGLYMTNEGSGYGLLGVLVFIAAIVATIACWRLTRLFVLKEATG